jgi:hypothetical protein
MGKIEKVELLKDLVQDAIDKGAKSVEEIHKTIAALPFETLEKAGLTDSTLKEKHNQFLSSVYGAIRNVNQQIGDFASDIFKNIEDGDYISKVMDKNKKK